MTLVAAAVVGYAMHNLSALVTSRRGWIVSRLSSALGRPVQVRSAQASAGWGLAVRLRGVTIADDPSFPPGSFLSAGLASVDVRFLPLLLGQVELEKVALIQPTIRLLRDVQGRLNIATLGNPAGGTEAGNPLGRIESLALELLRVKSLSIEDGTIYYSDESQARQPLTLRAVNFDLTDFRVNAPFPVALRMACFSATPNSQISGRIGPLVQARHFDPAQIPLDLKVVAGPIVLDKLMAVAGLNMVPPAGFSMPAPISGSGTISGTPQILVLSLAATLTEFPMTYHDAANLELTATISGAAHLGGSLKLPSGDVDIHLTLAQANTKLTVVHPSLNAKAPLALALTAVSSTTKLLPGGTITEAATFATGGGRSNFKARVDSLTPLRASFTLQADALPFSRPAGQVMNRLAANGSVLGNVNQPVVSTKITSGDGTISGIVYHNLDAHVLYSGDRLEAQPFGLEVFDGALAGGATVALQTPPRFNCDLHPARLDITKLLRWEGIQSSMLHGRLSGAVEASGVGTELKQIEPSLAGRGHMAVVNGALAGVNVVAIAINKIATAPGVSQLVNAAFKARHRGMLADPNTELQQASLSFILAGDRATTHDLVIRSRGYGMTGGGWFDFNKNISMTGDIRLSRSVAIPVVITGQYPVLLVVPNIPKLAERVATGAVGMPLKIFEGTTTVGSALGGQKR